MTDSLKERIQLETARLYKQAWVNPLAGCLPTLATIPVWIGLCQALSNVANEGLFTEGFFGSHLWEDRQPLLPGKVDLKFLGLFLLWMVIHHSVGMILQLTLY